MSLGKRLFIEGEEQEENLKYAVFNGVNSKITIPAISSISGTAARSFAFKMKVNSGGYQEPIFIYGGAGGSQAQLFLFATSSNTSAYDLAFFGNYSDAFYNSPTSIYGSWFDVVITYASSTMKFYIDGSLVHTGSLPLALNTQNTTFSIGGGWGSNYYDGALDSFKIFNTELSANAVTALFNEDTGSSNYPSSPIAYYRFEGNALDETGNYNATSVTNVTYVDY